MSRVGKNPISIPAGSNVQINGNLIEVSGKLGKGSFEFSDFVTVEKTDNKILVKPRDESTKARVFWGTTQRQIANLVKGTDSGFKLNLELIGVGYRASVQGSNLVLQLGYSHDITFPIPEGIKIVAEKPTSLSITGSSSQKVGQVAAVVRSYRPPEPYKGKGIYREQGVVKGSETVMVREYILRKEGKKK